MNYQLLEIDDLELDLANPRIRRWLEIYEGTPNAEQIYLALGAGSTDPESSSTTFNSLKESIRTNKGVINPIIVKAIPNGRFLVVEGNTRVAIYRNFRDDEVPGNWGKIPAIVHASLNQVGVDAIRLQAHLVGPRPWDPYSKAKYLHSLRYAQGMQMATLVDLCGGKSREVQEYINAYADMEKHYRKVIADDTQFDPTRFSAFVELQKPAIKEALLKKGHSLDDFAKWIHERHIDPLNTVRLLPRVFANPNAYDVFQKSGAREAAKLIEAPPPPAAGTLSLEELTRAMAQRIAQLPYNEMKRLQSDPTHPLAQALLSLQEDLQVLCTDIRNEGG